MSNKLATQVMQRIEALAKISEEQDRLTRAYGTPAMRKANELVGSWMREAGMTVSEDAIGNLIGHYPGCDERAKTFVIGSHLDTVRDAGKFDGALGVLVGIACVQRLHEEKLQLPFAIEIVGFADEEGVRFHNTYLGSKVLAGRFSEKELKRFDSRGISLAEAIRTFGGDPDNLKAAARDPQKLLGYAEVHIEQGPVLEKKYQPVGVVTAIAGQSRIKARFLGQAGHAGTTPMTMRRDALAAAAKFIVAVETCARAYPGLVATVGQIEARPGASNVIAGEVVLSIDVRHQEDSIRTSACAGLQETANHIAEKRGIDVDWETVQEMQSTPCSRDLTAMLAKAARLYLMDVTELPSGAGHDAAIMGDITPIAMLFVRCKGGISHHPDESAREEDVEVAIAVMSDFLQHLGNQQNPYSGKKRA